MLQEGDLEFLRPCPKDALPPYMIGSVVGKKLSKDKKGGQHLTTDDLNIA